MHSWISYNPLTSIPHLYWFDCMNTSQKFRFPTDMIGMNPNTPINHMMTLQ